MDVTVPLFRTYAAIEKTLTEFRQVITKELWQTALNVQAFLQSLNVPFCFIGGIAVQRWGEPRVTKDVDAVLFTDFGKETRFAERLLAQYKSRISLARKPKPVEPKQ